MRIIDTYNEILDVFLPNPFSMPLWRGYANSISMSMAQKVEDDSSQYDIDHQVIPVIQQAIRDSSLLIETHDSFVHATQGLDIRVLEVLGCDIEVDIILYLGLCNGAGWATSIDGRPTVLLGIEKIIECNWYDRKRMSSLLFHELGHIWHDAARKGPAETVREQDRSVWQLYREGMAMYCEQLLCNDLSFYHQDVEGWLSWCAANKKDLFLEFIRRAEKGESTQDFFGDWCHYQGYADVGYYLGCEFVKHLLNIYSLAEIAELSIGTLTGELSRMAV